MYRFSLFVAGALLLLLPCVFADDYYDLLGIDRQATTRDIRKAFKKLAISLHPDKNKVTFYFTAESFKKYKSELILCVYLLSCIFKDDPTAHEKFLKINRAYEVLKDDDLRKKYDMYGEDGLKEDGPSGRKYESWNFYNQNFGNKVLTESYQIL